VKPGHHSPGHNTILFKNVKQFTSMSSGSLEHYFDALYAAIRGLE
jgi:hypothetical protein